MELRRYQFIEHEMLRLAWQGSGDGLGYGTSLPTLWTQLRQSHADIGNQEIVDALKRLQPKYLTLWKWCEKERTFVEYSEGSNDDKFFYTNDFRLRRTPYTDPQLQELAALAQRHEADGRNKMRFSPMKAWFSTADEVLNADVGKLGHVLLKQLKTYEGGGTVHQSVGGFNRDYYIGVMEGRPLGLGPLPTQPEYADKQPQVSRRMQEAWNWAVLQGFLMQNPDQPHPGWFVFTAGGEDFLAGLTMTQGEEHTLKSIRGAGAGKSHRKVFVVHGHDDGAREKIARFLERLDLEPIILHEQANRGRTIIEKVEAHSDVAFAVVLLTPDDEGRKMGGTLQPRARQNVVLELGYFIGLLGRTHVCALRRGDLEIPSDFDGVVYVAFDDSDGWKQALGRELEAADFKIDWNKAMGAR